MKIVQHVSAVYIGSNNVWIAIERLGKIAKRLLLQSTALINVSGEQGNIGLFRQDVPVLRCEVEKRVVLSLTEQVVAKIDNHVAILRHNFDRLTAGVGRFLVFTVEIEVSLGLAQDLCFFFHGASYAIQPLRGEGQVMRLNSCVDASSYDQRIVRI